MSDSSSGGSGCAGVLGIVFIVLKLVGTISWSWWWVLSPFWIPLVLITVVFGIVAFFAAFSGHK